jgi:hypothetical protein
MIFEICVEIKKQQIIGITTITIASEFVFDCIYIGDP